MPYISTEALLGAGLLVVLALAYQYLPKADSPSGTSKKRKNKKKGGAKDVQQTNHHGKEPVKEDDKASAQKERGKGQKPIALGPPNGNGVATSNGTSTSRPDEQKPAPTQSTSFAAAAAKPAAQKPPKTLAEKLAPKEPKTKVDDMLAPEDRPGGYARVMSIKDAPASNSPFAVLSAPEPAPTVAQSSDQKVSKYEQDYAESSSSGEENGWDVVASKKKKPISLSIGGGGNSSQSTPSTQPLPTETKVQRKNAKKAEAKKAARAAEEDERQRRLAMHKRDLKRERINDIYGKSKGPATGKSAGAGSKATLDGNGKLIWD